MTSSCIQRGDRADLLMAEHFPQLDESSHLEQISEYHAVVFAVVYSLFLSFVIFLSFHMSQFDMSCQHAIMSMLKHPNLTISIP